MLCGQVQRPPLPRQHGRGRPRHQSPPSTSTASPGPALCGGDGGGGGGGGDGCCCRGREGRCGRRARSLGGVELGAASPASAAGWRVRPRLGIHCSSRVPYVDVDVDHPLKRCRNRPSRSFLLHGPPLLQRVSQGSAMPCSMMRQRALQLRARLSAPHGQHHAYFMGVSRVMVPPGTGATQGRATARWHGSGLLPLRVAAADHGRPRRLPGRPGGPRQRFWPPRLAVPPADPRCEASPSDA